MKKFFKFLSIFFKWCWTILSFSRQLLLNLLFIGVLIAIYFNFIMKDTEYSNYMEQHAHALLVDLSGPIVEKAYSHTPYDLAIRALSGRTNVTETVLFDVVAKIRTAANDNNINGMVLNLDYMSKTSLTTLQYIAKAIKEFKATGKPVIAFGDNYSQSQYYLASYADEVIMIPEGLVSLKGYGVYNLYYKNLLKSLNINTHIFRGGAYKSYVEPYIRTDMSQKARENNSIWLKQLWSTYINDIATNRGVTAESLSLDTERLLDAIKIENGDYAAVAQNLGLVDVLLTRQQTHTRLAEIFGSDGQDSYNYTSIYGYHAKDLTPSKTDQIAVVVASGTIIDGSAGEGTVGGDTTAAILRTARFNDAIKAVILRVDSSGGSAYASEIIHHEVNALVNAGKPVVVSMSDVAASGGYSISSSANRILAQAATITGSIGVISIYNTIEDALAKCGIYSDGIGTTPFVGLQTTRPMPEKISEILQLSTDHSYQHFIEQVANDRHISVADVQLIAQGQVWTGHDAMKYGLVDQIGDFDDAIVIAAELANISEYSLNWMHEPLTPIQQLFYDIIAQVMTTVSIDTQFERPSIIKRLATSAISEIHNLNNLNDPNGRYTLCQNCSYFDN
ncbi:signal peptide peptidase SppA [Candidatus Enterovibrio altilux]|uniref:signal peptide peptidase SppA n=1 Tax=Candidatus Enterovibrio altilux TaxID=1927128 RepID=UPI001237A2E7|nr:signal peptide peptidase SppA [Candidatus Enterovibrio luxaltus]